MIHAEFNYNGETTIVQCNLSEKVKKIIIKFIKKRDININTVYFVYNSFNIILDESELNEIINEKDIKRKKINILVYPKISNENKILNNNKKNSITSFVKYEHDINKEKQKIKK